MQGFIAILLNTYRKWLRYLAIFLACLCFAQTLSAQTANGVPEDTKADALSLARHIQDQGLIVTKSSANNDSVAQLSPSKQLAYLRQKSIDALTARKSIDSDEAITIYAQKAKEYGSQRDIDIAFIYGNLSPAFDQKI